MNLLRFALESREKKENKRTSAQLTYLSQSVAPHGITTKHCHVSFQRVHGGGGDDDDDMNVKNNTKKPPNAKKHGPSLGIVGWGLLLTSPLLLLCVFRARARRWLLRATLSVCFPVMKALARALGLVKASEWDPNARTIEDPVRLYSETAIARAPPRPTRARQPGERAREERERVREESESVVLSRVFFSFVFLLHPLHSLLASASHRPYREDLPVWLAGVSSLTAAERRAGKELWEWWLDALSFRSDSAGRLHIREMLKHPSMQSKLRSLFEGLDAKQTGGGGLLIVRGVHV